MKGAAIDPRRHNISDQMRFSMMISEMLMHEADQSSITGFVGVQDMDGMTLGHATQFSPSLGKKAMTIWQVSVIQPERPLIIYFWRHLYDLSYKDAYPQRPKGMHFLNMPGLMEGIFSMMKSFSKEKMRDRLIVHPKGDLSMLHEAVGTEILPKEFGGTNGTLQDHIGKTRPLDFFFVFCTPWFAKILIMFQMSWDVKWKRTKSGFSSKANSNQTRRNGPESPRATRICSAWKVLSASWVSIDVRFFSLFRRRLRNKLTCVIFNITYMRVGDSKYS